MTQVKPNPMDELLRARLRIPHGADKRLKALRLAMGSVDWVARRLGGLPFFALAEAEAMLIELDGRTGPDLVRHVLAMNGGTTITAHGLDNVPKTGPVVIGSTHPIGTFDFVSHAAALLDHRPDLKVVANREAQRFLGEDTIIAVDLSRKEKVLTARDTMTGMVNHLKDDGAILIFGSGRVPGMEDGYLRERNWRTGITRVSGKTGAAVIPACTDMRNSAPYYRTRRVAKFLSGGNDDVGREVASLRYVSELIAKLGGAYDVHYGPALPPGTAPEDVQRAAEQLVPGMYPPSQP